MTSSKLTAAAVALAAAALALPLQAAPAPAQGAEERRAGAERIVYEREVFRYDRAGMRDPFRSLLGSAELAIRVENLRVAAVFYSPDGRSVAILHEQGSDRRHRVRVGDRLGSIQVRAITPRRVDLIVDELGERRQESLPVRAETPQRGR